ncbi:hypothetical protein HQ545_06280 [Candidatus Woesearchaeota archaeon]|nr:hypothetical protein [Candidatus Woesearchaeota archaeon]
MVARNNRSSRKGTRIVLDFKDTPDGQYQYILHCKERPKVVLFELAGSYNIDTYLEQRFPFKSSCRHSSVHIGNYAPPPGTSVSGTLNSLQKELNQYRNYKYEERCYGYSGIKECRKSPKFKKRIPIGKLGGPLARDIFDDLSYGGTIDGSKYYPSQLEKILCLINEGEISFNKGRALYVSEQGEGFLDIFHLLTGINKPTLADIVTFAFNHQ